VNLDANFGNYYQMKSLVSAICFKIAAYRGHDIPTEVILRSNKLPFINYIVMLIQLIH